VEQKQRNMKAFIEKNILEFNNLRYLDIYLLGHKGYIAGGCFKNIFLKQINDTGTNNRR